MTENQQVVHEAIVAKIRIGFEPITDITEAIIDYVDDEGWSDEINEEWIENVVENEYYKHLEVSKTWQHPTSTETLSEVFDELCREKIIALHNAGYTTSEAIYEVGELFDELEDMGKQPIGYCYYHEQDLERVVSPEGGNLFIGFYGIEDNDVENALQVGNQVYDKLTEKGFKVEWDKTADTRIEIIDLNWKKIWVSDRQDEVKWSHSRVLDLMK